MFNDLMNIFHWFPVAYLAVTARVTEDFRWLPASNDIPVSYT
jgi:hypothetical protein